MKIKYILATLLLSFILFVPESYALKLIFKRVVFEDSKRADFITFFNNTNKERTFRVEWREMVMDPVQGLRRATPQEIANMQYKVSDMIRYSPRRVNVPAQSSQQIRLMLRTPSGLPDGEYRSHIVIKQEADQDGLDNPSGPIVEALPAMSLPVFVRKGKLSSGVEIETFTAQNLGNAVRINLALNRTGNKSIYMNFNFVCNPQSSYPYLLNKSNQNAIYAEIDKRYRSYDFRIPPNQEACREVGLKINEPTNNSGKNGELYASKIIIVQ